MEHTCAVAVDAMPRQQDAAATHAVRQDLNDRDQAPVPSLASLQRAVRAPVLQATSTKLRCGR